MKVQQRDCCPPASHGLQPSEMQRAVLDTNVVFDGYVFQDAASAPVFESIRRGEIRWLACPTMLAEAREVLARGTFEGRPSDDADFCRWWQARVQEADPGTLGAASHGMRCSDPDDQMFLDLAVSSDCRWLLTKDRALLRLAPRARAFRLSILTPTAALASPDWPAAKNSSLRAEA